MLFLPNRIHGTQAFLDLYQNRNYISLSNTTNYATHYFFFQLVLFFCFARPKAKDPAGTSEVTTEPAATYDFLPTFSGATNAEFEPIKTESPILVLCLFSPS